MSYLPLIPLQPFGQSPSKPGLAACVQGFDKLSPNGRGEKASEAGRQSAHFIQKLPQWPTRRFTACAFRSPPVQFAVAAQRLHRRYVNENRRLRLTRSRRRLPQPEHTHAACANQLAPH